MRRFTHQAPRPAGSLAPRRSSLRDPGHRILLALATLLAHVGLVGWVTRGDLAAAPSWTHAGGALALHALALACWAAMLGRTRTDGPDRLWWATAIAARVLLIAALPNLSDDVYRFVWDGRLTAMGMDPFAATPDQVWATATPAARAALTDVYGPMNSRGFHTVYPPLLQAWFAWGAAWFPTSLAGHVAAMKAVLVAADLATLALLHDLAHRWQLPRWSPWLYGLHPLVILELAGNLHTEVFAILGIVAALGALDRARPGLAGLALSLAVGTKLLPLILVPFVLRRLSPAGRVRFLATLTAATALPFLAMMDAQALAHMGTSLRLYTAYFEWNGLVFRLVKQLTGSQATGTALALLTGLLLMLAVLKDRGTTPRDLAIRWLGALTVYQLLATTVHPWYLTPLLALAALGPYRFPHLWGALIPLTYVAYWRPGIQESSVVLALEYGLVLPYLAYEVLIAQHPGGLEAFVRRHAVLRRLFAATLPPRIRIKLDRLAPHLPTDGPILDLGCGHGGVCRALRAQGHTVLPIDVADRSWFDDVRPPIYDGGRLPFPDHSVPTVLLATVLHHTADPDAVLAEAARVAQHRIVVMEDVYTSAWQRALTLFTDSLVNLEFRGHPHTNRDDAGWRATFHGLGLTVVASETRPTLGLFAQAVYVLSAGQLSPSSTLHAQNGASGGHGTTTHGGPR